MKVYFFFNVIVENLVFLFISNLVISACPEIFEASNDTNISLMLNDGAREIVFAVDNSEEK